ncbi:MAG: hypothetical protein GQ574_07540 [Crocinitomix sp.]|nr:hypothetical protein [Crocinitomix sp.]
MILIKKICIALCFVLPTIQSAFSQEHETLNKHTFLIKSSVYNFFDGGPTIQTNYRNRPNWLSNGYGIEYMNTFGNNSMWSVSLDNFSFENHTPLPEKESGEYWKRRFYDIRASYSKSFFQTPHHSLFWNTGLSVRIGYEAVFGNYFQVNEVFGESFAIGKKLRDLGALLGLKYHVYIGKHVTLLTALSYTIYPLTWDSKDENYEYDRGPTWNMISLSLGIGFNYGK